MNKTIKIIGIVSILIFQLALISAAIQWSTTTSTRFEVRETGLHCIDNSRWVNYLGGVSVSDVSSLENCYNESSSDISRACCPAGHICSLATKKCVESSVRSCSDYTDSASCNAFTPAIAITSSNDSLSEHGKYCGWQTGPYTKNGKICGTAILDCKCVWENGNCSADWTEFEKCGNDPGNIKGHCTYKNAKTTNNCETDGTLFYEYDSLWTPISSGILQGNCTGGRVELSCRSTVKLPFFSALNVVIAILIIIVIYFAFIFNKKKIRKK